MMTWTLMITLAFNGAIAVINYDGLENADECHAVGKAYVHGNGVAALRAHTKGMASGNPNLPVVAYDCIQRGPTTNDIIIPLPMPAPNKG